MALIPISQPTITYKEIAYVTEAVSSGWVSSLGKYIDLFEAGFAAYCGTSYAVSVSNGTTALHLALTALGITTGDEVIVPDLTFVATANAVKYTGADVVLVDVDDDTLCINPQAIECAITRKTKAIIPVHLYGHPANMGEISQLAKKHNLLVIEDAAEAHGATVNGRKVGSLGDLGVFSFYGNKIITTGEGGMITTNDEALYYRLRFLRDHAMSKQKRYWHTELGFNYRMTNLQAALGLAQLERIEEILAKKKAIFEWYREALADVPGIRLNPQASWATNVYWMICVEIDNYSESQRDTLISILKMNDIDSRPYFYPVSDMPIYQSVFTPVTHNHFKKGINFPNYFDLTKEQVDYICSLLKELLASGTLIEQYVYLPKVS